MSSRKQDPHKPPFAKDRVERGLEADDTRPLYSDESRHATRELKFAFDSDGPAGGDVPDIRSPIDEVDELERERRGRGEVEEEEEQA